MSDEHHPSPPSAAPPPLGRWLEGNRTRATAWKKAFHALLALLAGLNFVLRPEEPHFGADAWPLFWPLFGLLTGVGIIFLVKRIIQPWLLKRPEDYYGDL